MRGLRALSRVGLVSIALGCRDDPRRVLTETAAPQAGSVLYLTTSDQAPPPGSTVTVTANVAPTPDIKAIGSFAAHLRYDTAGLTFIAESRLPSGMRVLNPQPGHIRAAGAAVEGFADGRLFAVTFRVTDPGALTSMELTLDEMTGTDFGNRLPANPLHRSARLGSTRR